ncbi:NAD-dependent deacetylase-like protein sirtuin-5 [Microthyrium microscopicum]|uniref:NAD-dependent deacetylase-like protein sirtuin-5 n=1 Tax=Microthyrium microscopicum TaxID=703497 RepID=A0A6A6UCH4_9PEZI|nr:NAD-dependent deacetylase-like protein sirtuin-5 [Microthyrium microscopicum]
MAASTTRLSTLYPHIPPSAIESFHAHLASSTRVLALLGAGLSASSGLPTFRGAGGLWRTHEATDLATPQAFSADPGLVWQFYSYRRHMALNVKPNMAHYALAEFAKKMPGFQTLSQNVDGLSPRAGHPAEQLKLLHGSLFDVKCHNFFCNYVETANYTDPIVPALALPTDEDVDLTTNAAREASREARELDIADISVALPDVPETALPHCPSCGGLLRPGVVWFGESLPAGVLETVDAFLEDPLGVDLILVIGTSARVFPAAGYIEIARSRGARVAVINTEMDLPPGQLTKDDWFFQGDAAVIVPELLRPVVGDLEGVEEKL